MLANRHFQTTQRDDDPARYDEIPLLRFRRERRCCTTHLSQGLDVLILVSFAVGARLDGEGTDL